MNAKCRTIFFLNVLMRALVFGEAVVFPLNTIRFSIKHYAYQNCEEIVTKNCVYT